MIAEETPLPGLLILRRSIHADRRGRFSELWRDADYREAGIRERFVQENSAVSHQRSIRGLHLQHPHAQGKLVTVLHGIAFEALVDARRGSPTFGRHFCMTLAGDDGAQIYVPPGLAHGTLALSPEVVLVYKCTSYYAPEAAIAIRWNDPALGIHWPVQDPILSDADAAAPLLAELPLDALPPFEPYPV